METNDVNKDGFVTWDEYKNNTYGFLDGMYICHIFLCDLDLLPCYSLLSNF